jgi:hypothetical protein
MVPKSGTRLLKSQPALSDAALAELIGSVLRTELGASRRATKTVMSWTGVSDHTARAWLNGRTSPSGAHLVVLAAHCRAVLTAILELTGHEDMALMIDIEAIEERLQAALAITRSLRGAPH